MLNITPIRGNNQYAAAHYFSSADDYYAKEHAGQWQGQGAAALGLDGPIDPALFARMLAGKLPNGEQIQASFDAAENKKRMGLDLTFSAPKSVSMQALIAGDQAVTEAHDRAVTRALEQVEPLALARKKVQGKTYKERTGNLVIGKFRHELSRAKDPQLHTHAVVLNMTQRKDGKWRALSNEDLFRVHYQVEAIYKAELAKELQALGYEIRLTDDAGAFELGHISREQIEAFSARSKVIEDALAHQGKTRATATTLDKQIIALATRPRKDERDREIIKAYWVDKSRDLGIDYGAHPPPGPGGGYEPGGGTPAPATLDAESLPRNLTPVQAVVRYAIDHLTEREAVVTETRLVATALQRAVGLADTPTVKAEIARLAAQGTLIEAVPAYRLSTDTRIDGAGGKSLSARGWQAFLRELKGWEQEQARDYVSHAIEQGSLVAADKRYTTQKALQWEKAILAIERSGRGQVKPIVRPTAVQRALAESDLSAGQRSAVQTIVSTANRFTGIQGDAGTGKTYAVNRAVDLLQGQGWRALALAPYANHVKALKSQGLDAHTLASFLYTKQKPIDAQTVIVLDESAVVPARQMVSLMKIVEQAQARLVMLGDTKQTEAIEAGKPFAQLQEAGMQTVRIHEIQRQHDPQLKEAVAYAADGNVSASLDKIRHLAEWPEPPQRHDAIVADYMRLAESERRDTLIVAGTNEARQELNRRIRAATGLAGTGREFDTLTRVDMTQAQRRFAPSYAPGTIVQPERDYPKAGLARGALYTVREALPGNKLMLETPERSTLAINPRTVTRLSVYEKSREELAAGDIIRINRNDPARDLTNGDRMRVTGVSAGALHLASLDRRASEAARSVELPATQPLHLEPAYASTVHSAQGLSSARVLIDLNTRSRTTSMNLYYVAISRARHEARIYTNSTRDLPAAISRCFDKTTALAVHRERKGPEYGRFA